MAIQKSTTTPNPQVVLARFRKDFKNFRDDQIKRDQAMVDFSKAHLKHAQETLRMWQTKKSWSRSIPCCLKCEKYVYNGSKFCPECGSPLVVIDLYPHKTKKAC